MGRFLLGWEDLCSNGKICAPMGRFVLKWEDLCSNGKICARMGRFVLGWEDFCSDGKIFDRMGRFGLGWEDLCLDGKDVFVCSSACKLHSWLLTALKSLTHSDRFKHNGELAKIMDKNHFNSKMYILSWTSSGEQPMRASE